MIAKLTVALIAISIAGVVTAALWNSQDPWRKLIPALGAIGLAAYGIALIAANGSC